MGRFKTCCGTRVRHNANATQGGPFIEESHSWIMSFGVSPSIDSGISADIFLLIPATLLGLLFDWIRHVPNPDHVLCWVV